MKNKKVFLYVSGEFDKAFRSFCGEYDFQEVYEDMVSKGLTEMTIENKYEDEWKIEIKEFGEIDDDFIKFVYDICEAEEERGFVEVEYRVR